MIIFVSRTGNVRDVVGRLDKSIPTIELPSLFIIEEPYFLFTYTDGLGDIPLEVKDFLDYNELNRSNLKGVIASGNLNFGNSYCGCAAKISRWLNVPVIRNIDLRGNQSDVAAIVNSYKKIIEGENI